MSRKSGHRFSEKDMRKCKNLPFKTAPETPMTQTSNRFFDEAARLMNDAAGVAQGVRREFDTLVRTQAERILNDLDVVRRDEFEAAKEMARLAREENEALKARIAALEAKVAGTSTNG
jgi:BMFP domain-containing protein YqiC